MNRRRSGLSGFRASAGLLGPMLRALSDMRADVAAIVESVGLTMDQLRDPDARFPFEVAVRLGAAAARAVQDPAFGLHLAELYRPGDFGLLDYLAHNSRTLHEALVRLCRYNRLLQDAVETTVDVAGGRAVVWQNVLGDVWIPPGSVENALANLVIIGRQLTGRPIVPLHVEFRHGAPNYAGEHERIFGGPVRFDSTRDALVMAPADLALPLANADPALCSILDRHAQKLLADLPRVASFGVRVRELIVSTLKDESPSEKRAASRLGMSARTLRRRLKQEGTTFEAIMGDLRRALAAEYLRHDDLSLDHLALLLGYSETSAFRRAFRRWYGISPVAYRRRQRSARSGPRLGWKQSRESAIMRSGSTRARRGQYRRKILRVQIGHARAKCG
jgi:AraC-like DNA-binding protein